MIRVKFVVPNDDPDWRDWVQRARAARRRLAAADIAQRSKMIDDDLYKEQRPRFFRAFHGKCAYCELPLAPGQRYGDVEHFRPKLRVTDIQGRLIFSKAREHGGYWWLAYSWRNLLPACEACNRFGTGPDGLKSGKWDRFPTVGDVWYQDARGIRRERPLLLNPLEDDPNEHLVFDDTGVIGHRTERGRTTIEVLGLNRDALVDERRVASRRAADDVRRLFEAYARLDVDEAKEYEGRLRDVEGGRVPFSAAARAAVQRAYERQRAMIQRYPLGGA